MPSATNYYDNSVSFSGVVCMVVPMRLAVFLTAVSTVIFSSFLLLDILWWGAFVDVLRLFFGGYTRRSEILVCLMSGSGIFFGTCGTLGVWYVQPKWINAFGAWQLLRMVEQFLMYLVDVPMLMQCEDFANNIGGVKSEWSYTMYDIAMNGSCTNEQVLFFVFSMWTTFVYMYLVYATYSYSSLALWQPKHLLRMTKDLAEGSHEARLKGERMTLGHHRAWQKGAAAQHLP